MAGVEISQDYLYRLLPEEELSDDGCSGYAIVGDGGGGSVEPLIVQGAMLRQVLPYGESLQLRLENKATDSYAIFAGGTRLSGHLEQLPLYNRNTPFAGTHWYVMGVTGEASLTRYSDNLTKILTTAMSVSLLIGIAFAMLMGFFFSKPLKALEAQIHSFRPGDRLRLTPTGILEIDALSQAVEQLNEDVLNSVLKTDKIIDMVNLDIGSFEYRTGDETVKVSATLAAMLQLPRSEEGYVDKTVFADCLHRIKEKPTEDHLYAFGSNPVKWLKLEDVTTDSGEFGIVMDATRDELARIALKRDRDFDSLTGIYNRFAFQRVMTQLFAERDFTHAAFIMCDLDN
ncbi:MAG: GGDEF domain-containing protein, partial [Oscillospiraceae bacterium]